MSIKSWWNKVTKAASKSAQKKYKRKTKATSRTSRSTPSQSKSTQPKSKSTYTPKTYSGSSSKSGTSSSKTTTYKPKKSGYTPVTLKSASKAKAKQTASKTTTKVSNTSAKQKSELTKWQKAARKGQNRTYLGTEQRKESVEIGEKKNGKKEFLTGTNALTQNEFNRMVEASRYGKEKGDKILKGKNGTGGDIRKKVGTQTAKSAYESKAATGVMQGLSKADIFSNSVGTYDKKAKKAIKKTKESAAYNIGYGAGMAADMALGGVSAKGASIAKGIGKKAAKETAEAVGKKTAKQTAKKFAKNRAGELVAETPSNILDAAKMSIDEDGKVDKKTFAKYAAINTGLTAGVGGAIEGVGGAITKKTANKAIELLGKQRAGTITKAESEELGKAIKTLSKKNTDTISGDIAGNAKTDIKRSAETARLEAKRAKGRSAKDNFAQQRWNKSKAEYDAQGRKLSDKQQKKNWNKSQSEYSSYKGKADAKADAELTGFRADANKAKAVDNAKKIQTEAKKLPSRAEIRAKIDDATDRLETLKASRASATSDAMARVIDDSVAKVEHDIAELKRQEGVVWNAEKSVEKYGDVIAPKTPTVKAEKPTATEANIKAEENVPNAEKIPSEEATEATEPIKAEEPKVSESRRRYDEAKEAFDAARKRKTSAEIAARRSEKKHGTLSEERARERDEARAEYDEAKRNLEEAENNHKFSAVEDDESYWKNNDTPYPTAEISKENPHADYKAHRQAVREEKIARGEIKETPTQRNEKAVKEKSKAKQMREKLYNEFVSTLAPFERVVNKAAKTSEEARLGRAKINDMLLAKSKARNMIDNEGQKIFTSRGLHKDPEKMEAYDDFAILTHELERLQQKRVNYMVDDKAHTMDVSKYVGKNGEVDEAGIREALSKKHDDYYWDGEVSDKGGLGLTEDQVTSVLADLEKKYGDDIKAYQQELVNYHKKLLDLDYEAGIITKKVYDELQTKYPNYVPMFRENEVDLFDQMAPQAEINVARLYDLKGYSDAAVLPMYSQMVAKTNKVFARTAENDMLNAVAQINGMKLTDLPGGHTPGELLEVSTGVYRDTGGQTCIFFYQEGKGVSMPISEEMHTALNQWTNPQKAAMMKYKLIDLQPIIDNKVTRTIGRGFKAWITDYSLIFGARNFARDARTAMLYSEYPVQWMAALPKAIMGLMPESAIKALPKAAQDECMQYKKLFNAYKANGGKYSSLVTSNDLSKAAKLGQRKDGIPVLRIAKNINDTLETIPRMQEFVATMEREAKKFDGDLDRALTNKDSMSLAMYNAKEATLNFDRQGVTGAMLNRGIVPFFNPSIQGLDKLIRFMTTDNHSARDFANMAVKLTTMVAMPIAAFETFIGDNEDYHKLSAYNKYNYLCIPLGKDENGDAQFLKVPRAREIGALQAPIEWLYENMKYQSRDGTANLFDSSKQLGKTMVSQIGPVNPITDNLFSPFINIARNKTWFGSDVEAYDDQEKRKAGNVSDIYDSDTSSAAVSIMTFINKKENGALETLGVGKDTQNWIKKHQVSPKQLDNVFDSYLGVIYDMGLSAFSQKGTSIDELKKNPESVMKRLTVDPYVSAFVINGTLSSARKTTMYSKLDALNKKMDNSAEGSAEYNKASAEISRMKNNVVYDVSTLESAIDNINRNEKLSSTKKKNLVMQLKREQNALMDNYEKTGNSGNDPLKTLMNMKDKSGKSVFTTEEVINTFTYTNKDTGKNSIRDGYNLMKESDEYKKHPKATEKKFLDVTFATRDVAGKCGDGKSYIDYKSMAIVCASKNSKNGNDYSGILDAYQVNESSRKAADIYINQMGGSKATYIASHKHIVAGAQELGTYANDLKDHDYAMILANAKTKAGNKLKDRAYFIEDLNSSGTYSFAHQRMNPARCLTSDKYKKSNWSYQKVHKFADDNNLDYKSSDEKIVAAIEQKYPNKTREEKAALFLVIKPTDESPYGKIGDYSEDGDRGYSSGYGGGYGRRGYRRRGYGRGRGSGGGSSAFTPEVYKAGKITTQKTHSFTEKSNLDDAYRKKAKKLRESTRK